MNNFPSVGHGIVARGASTLLRRQRLLAIAFTIVATSVVIAPAQAAIVTVPTSLSPGDKYYLAFVTAGTISGTSTDVAVYNTFAQDQANAAGLGTISGSPVTWKALVSTASVTALTNLGIGSFPIFLLNDVQLATGSTDLWNGSIAVPLRVTQSGSTLVSGAVWTGSVDNGNAYNPYQLGTSTPIIGGLNSTGSAWVVAGSNPNTTANRLYAFSEQLTVPAVVPEPASISIALCGVAIAGWTMARRRARQAR